MKSFLSRKPLWLALVVLLAGLPRFSRLRPYTSSYLILLFLALSLPFSTSGQSSLPPGLRLSAVHIVGLKKFGETEVIAQSNLNLGQIVTSEMLAQTAASLARTGAFKSVQYSYRYSDREVAVEFRVEEVGKFLTGAFDNFVWFTDREILEAVQQAVPMFQGLAPESGDMTDEMTAALNDLLKKRGIPGQVEHTLTGDISSGRLEQTQHLFLVSGVTMPIHSVIFERTSILDKNLLRERSKPLIDNNYSREFLK